MYHPLALSRIASCMQLRLSQIRIVNTDLFILHCAPIGCVLFNNWLIHAWEKRNLIPAIQINHVSQKRLQDDWRAISLWPNIKKSVSATGMADTKVEVMLLKESRALRYETLDSSPEVRLRVTGWSWLVGQSIPADIWFLKMPIGTLGPWLSNNAHFTHTETTLSNFDTAGQLSLCLCFAALQMAVTEWTAPHITEHCRRAWMADLRKLYMITEAVVEQLHWRRYLPRCSCCIEC